MYRVDTYDRYIITEAAVTATSTGLYRKAESDYVFVEMQINGSLSGEPIIIGVRSML